MLTVIKQYQYVSETEERRIEHYLSHAPVDFTQGRFDAAASVGLALGIPALGKSRLIRFPQLVTGLDFWHMARYDENLARHYAEMRVWLGNPPVFYPEGHENVLRWESLIRGHKP